MTPLEQAASYLPSRLRNAVFSSCLDAEEVHLRVGRAFSVTTRDGLEQNILAGGAAIPVTMDDLRTVVELATCASYHAAAQRLCQGFLPLRGGHRLGLTGTVSVQNGQISAIQHLSSLCLRIAHPMEGIAEEVGQAVFGTRPVSTLLLSPPGHGKTTLLRDLLRIGSQNHGLRIGLADERGEVAALWNGVPQMNVGERTDVLDGCPKSEGLLLLLRSMSPQLLAADEITAPEDVAALSMAANCGVPVIATAHGSSIADLQRRPLYRPVFEERLFRQLILIQRTGSQRSYRVEELSLA